MPKKKTMANWSMHWFPKLKVIGYGSGFSFFLLPSLPSPLLPPTPSSPSPYPLLSFPYPLLSFPLPPPLLPPTPSSPSPSPLLSFPPPPPLPFPLHNPHYFSSKTIHNRVKMYVYLILLPDHLSTPSFIFLLFVCVCVWWGGGGGGGRGREWSCYPLLRGGGRRGGSDKPTKHQAN